MEQAEIRQIVEIDRASDPSTESKSARGPLVKIKFDSTKSLTMAKSTKIVERPGEGKSRRVDKANGQRSATSESFDQARFTKDRVESTNSPKSAKVTKGRVEPAKAPIPLSIYPDGEGDDPTSTYDDSRSGSSRRTHEDSSNNVDRSTTPIEGSKSKKPSPRKYGRVKANKCFINRALTTSTTRTWANQAPTRKP